jgi:hypothetical protein
VPAIGGAAGYIGRMIREYDLGFTVRQPGELAQVYGGFGVARAHQNPALASDQRKDMAGPREIGRAGIGVGKPAHGGRAVIGGDAGGGAVLVVDGHGKGGGVGRIIARHHGVEPQPLGLVEWQRRADDAAAMADDKGHLLRRAQRGGDDQIALVLAVIIIGDNDDLAAREGLDGI